MPGGTVTYLVHDEIFVIRLHGACDRAEQIASWRLVDTGGGSTFAGLTRGPDGAVILHRTFVTEASRRVSPITGVDSELVTANLRTRTIQAIPGTRGLTWPVLSPSGDWIAASATTLPYRGVHATVLFSMLTCERRNFAFERDAAAHAWGDSDDTLLLTALDSSGAGWDSIALDLTSGSFIHLAPGGRPVRCDQAGLLAVISSGQRSIEVRDFAGTIRYQFRDFLFRDIVQWIDPRRLLITCAVGPYRDSFAIADLETGMVHKYTVPSRGEISGAYYHVDPAA